MVQGIVKMDGRDLFYTFDEPQDALYITFRKQIEASYYDETDDPDLMIRRDGQTDEIVGVTVRNVSHRICEMSDIQSLEDEVKREYALFSRAA